MDLYEYGNFTTFTTRPYRKPAQLQTIALHCFSQLAIHSALNMPVDDLDKCDQLLEMIHTGIPPLLANYITEIFMLELVPALQVEDFSEAVRKRLLEAAVHPCTTSLFIQLWQWDHVVLEHFFISVLPSLKGLKKLSIDAEGGYAVDLLQRIHFPESLEEASFGPRNNDSLLVAVARFCPKLKRLKLGLTPQISDVGMKAVIELQHLEVLDIGGLTLPFNLISSVSHKLRIFRCTRAEAKRLNALARSPKFTQLSEIEVRHLICDEPLDDGLVSLTTLHIGHSRFSPWILSNVGHRLQELKFANVDGLDLWMLSEQCPVLQNLHLVFCKHSAPPTHGAKNLPSFLPLKHVVLDSNRDMCEWCTLRHSSALEKVTVIILRDHQEPSNACLDMLLENNSLAHLQEFGLHGRHRVITWELSSMMPTAVAEQLVKQCPRLAVLRGIQCCDSIKDIKKLRPDIKLFETCDPAIAPVVISAAFYLWNLLLISKTRIYL